MGRFWANGARALEEAEIFGVKMIAEAPAHACCAGDGARSAASGLIKGLRGEAPFDGGRFPRPVQRMIACEEGVDRRRDEEREHGADRHARRDDETDVEAAARASAMGDDERNHADHHGRGRHQDRTQANAGRMLDRLAPHEEHRAHEEVRLPHLVVVEAAGVERVQQPRARRD